MNHNNELTNVISVSKIPPHSDWAGLAGKTVHNPALDSMHPESNMPECFMKRWTF